MSATRSLTVQTQEVFWNRMKLKSYQVYKMERQIDIIQKAIPKSIQAFQTNLNHKLKIHINKKEIQDAIDHKLHEISEATMVEINDAIWNEDEMIHMVTLCSARKWFNRKTRRIQYQFWYEILKTIQQFSSYINFNVEETMAYTLYHVLFQSIIIGLLQTQYTFVSSKLRYLIPLGILKYHNGIIKFFKIHLGPVIFRGCNNKTVEQCRRIVIDRIQSFINFDGKFDEGIYDYLYQCNVCKTSNRKDGKKLYKCGGCRIMRYCSKKCQKICWNKQHRKDCMKIFV